jgi:DNA replication protein DnaC
VFELIGSRYERPSLQITANQPVGSGATCSPTRPMTLAAIDRLVHHATILEMNVRELQAPRRPRTQARLDPGAEPRDKKEKA